jgi:hypothetical protein
MSGLFLQRFGDRPRAVDLRNRGLLLLCSGASFSTGRTPENKAACAISGGSATGQ